MTHEASGKLDDRQYGGLPSPNQHETPKRFDKVFCAFRRGFPVGLQGGGVATFGGFGFSSAAVVFMRVLKLEVLRINNSMKE